jgi:hypothetical protein
MRTFLTIIAILMASSATAQLPEGVIARCGASKGHAYFFAAPMNPDGPRWVEDGISNGKIVLVRLGDEWDIQFDDVLDSSGYRQDGARVMLLMQNESLVTVGAFSAQYVDIYTFDLDGREVAWTSNKHGPIAPKSAAYRAKCE